MKYSVVSIFPEMIDHFTSLALLGKARSNKLIEIALCDPRDYSLDKHRKVDDRPFGGGAGMVFTPAPLYDAVSAIKAQHPGRVIFFSAYGRSFDQQIAKDMSACDHLILVCGRYDGIDQRVIDLLADDEISIGDYVLMGGEAAALVVIEAVSRLLPGVVGNPESVLGDSFFKEDQFACPVYTRPRSFQGLDVPEVLVNGNHAEIESWRKNNQKKRRKVNEQNN